MSAWSHGQHTGPNLSPIERLYMNKQQNSIAKLTVRYGCSCVSSVASPSVYHFGRGAQGLLVNAFSLSSPDYKDSETLLWNCGILQNLAF